MEYFYLKNIVKSGHTTKVIDWRFVQINNIRLYYKTHEKKGLGFSFYAFERTAWAPNEDKETEWSESSGECLINGVAYFDGIRHLYYGDEETENYGYHNYANIEMIIGVLKELRKLEKEYCNGLD